MSFVLVFFLVPFLKIWIFQVFSLWKSKSSNSWKSLEIFWDWGLGVFILDFVGEKKKSPKNSQIPKKIPKFSSLNPRLEFLWELPEVPNFPGSSFFNFYFNFLGGYLGSHWDRSIPGIFGIQNFDQECWSPWRIGGVFPIFEVFGKQIPIFFFPLESLGMQQFLGIFFSWLGKGSNSQIPSRKSKFSV